MRYLLYITIAMICVSCAAKKNTVSSTQQEAKQQSQQELAKIDQKQHDSSQTSSSSVKHIQPIEDQVEKERIKIKSEQNNIADDQPLAVIERYTRKLRTFVDQPNGKNKEDSIAKQVREFFNFQELAKRSLGKHWNNQSEQNRKQFSDLFIQLVESSYLKRSRDIIGDYEVTFKNQKIKGKEASVTSTVSQEDANIDIRYDLMQENNQWMIYNITLDDVNLVRTYQSQFNKIINDKGFSHLISMMKKRLAVQGSKDDVAL